MAKPISEDLRSRVIAAGGIGFVAACGWRAVRGFDYERDPLGT
jgi:hypothetical protein